MVLAWKNAPITREDLSAAVGRYMESMEVATWADMDSIDFFGLIMEIEDDYGISVPGGVEREAFATREAFVERMAAFAQVDASNDSSQPGETSK